MFPATRSMHDEHGAATTDVIAVFELFASFDSAMVLSGSTAAGTVSEVPALAVTVVVIVTTVVSPAVRVPVQLTSPTVPGVGPAGVQTKPPEAAAESRSSPAGSVARTTTAPGSLDAEPALVTVSL